MIKNTDQFNDIYIVFSLVDNGNFVGMVSKKKNLGSSILKCLNRYYPSDLTEWYSSQLNNNYKKYNVKSHQELIEKIMEEENFCELIFPFNTDMNMFISQEINYGLYRVAINRYLLGEEFFSFQGIVK